MSGQDFGKELKTLRMKAGIGSKELSQKVGKAVTYVSQLERGLIKNPDYNACWKLLEAVGFPKKHIDRHLESFGFISPELEEHILNENIKHAMHEEAKMLADPDAYYEQWREWYEDDKIAQLKDTTDSFRKMLDVFIDKDLTRAEKVIGNLENMLATKQNFEFLCALFELDFATIPNEKRTDFLQSIRKILPSK